MSVSQAAISRTVGVSRTAVSHVLNGRGHMVSDETRERILKAVEDSGYHRNALVRALRSNRTHVVGIVVPDARVSFFGNIIMAAEKMAADAGFQCFLCQSHNQPEELNKDVSALREYRADGILIVPSSSTDKPEMYRGLIQHKLPFVVVDVPIQGVKTPFVGNDNLKAGFLATEHLLKLGHRRIAYIKGYRGNSSTAERYEGYRRALVRARVSPDESLVTGDGFEFETGQDAVASLLRKKVKFTAIVTPSDVTALGAIQELSRKGLRVPLDVSVVGCGNLDVAAMVTPSLTTVDQDASKLGACAMRMLISLIEGGPKTAKSVIVPPRMIVRNSTCAFGGG